MEEERIVSVYVRDDSVLYACQPNESGFKCGKCSHGWILKINKRPHDCKACGAQFSGINTTSGQILHRNFNPVEGMLYL